MPPRAAVPHIRMKRDMHPCHAAQRSSALHEQLRTRAGASPSPQLRASIARCHAGPPGDIGRWLPTAHSSAGRRPYG
eukprot:364059-Chlamydomonas_euryale.AAC.1